MTQPANTLTIRFSSAGVDAYRLDLAGPHVGEVSGAFTSPFDSATWPAIWRGLQPGAELDAADRKILAPLGDRARLPETAGRALAGALLASEPVTNAFATALAVAAAERRPLPVELRFAGGTDAVAALPWELLHHDGRFLVADTSIALTRYPEGALPPTSALAELPLRVLLVLAEPVDAAPILPHQARADLLHGLRSLDEAGAVIVDLLRPPTFQALVEAVRTGGHHLLVFYGHGAPGGLLFEDEYGGGTSVKAGELGAALRNTEVRLVLLAAGQSAQPGPSIWSAAAPALVHAGVPLAIGLQTSLPVDAALAFIRQFALSLAAGKPVVEAVADGRLPLIRAGANWFAPALYGRPRSDTRLFDPAQALSADTAALRAEMHAARAEIARLEQTVGQGGVLTAPQEIAALRAARQRFADARAALAWRTPGGSSAATSPLYGVPTNPIFVGRGAELQQVSRGLRTTQPVVVWGVGGIGKTALAAEVARRQSWRFPGGVLWLDCRGGPAWDTLLDRMGSFCGLDMQQVEPDKKEATVRLALAGLEEGCLLVWDNAEDVWDGQLVRDFVAQLPASCRALITTREDPEQPMWTVTEVARLPDAAMAELLQRLAEAAGVKAAGPADLAAIPLILSWLQGHPLALELVVPLANRRGLARVWQDLQKRPLKGVEAALEASYQRLSEMQKRLFARLSVWSIPFDWPAAEALMPNTRDLDDALDTLVQRALIGFDGAHYSYHPLVRQVAYQKLCAIEESRRVHRLAARWLRGKVDGGRAAPEETLEEVDQWERAEEWEDFVLGAGSLVGNLDRFGYWMEIDDRLERAQRAVAEHLTGQPDLEAQVVYDQAMISFKRSHWDRAISLWQRSWEISKAIGDERFAAVTLGNLGGAYSRKGEWDKAIELFQQALLVNERLGESLAMAVNYHNLGNLYVDKAEWDKAIEFYRQSLEIKTRFDDVQGVAITYTSLGSVYGLKGEWDRAMELYQQALEIKARLGDIDSMAQTRRNSGNVYVKKGEWDKAFESLMQTLQTNTRLGDIYGMANTYASLGDLFFGRGSWDKAIEYFNASRQAFDELGDIHSMALVCSNLSGAYVHKGEWEKGIELCRQSLQILERLGDRYGMAAAYNNLGAHYRAIGNTQQAATYVAQAYLVLSSLGAAEARQSGQHLISILGSVEAANAFLTHFSSEQITLGQEFEQADQSTALDQLLDAVINACQSDAELGEQLFDFTRDLAADPAQPPDLRALGRVLQRVLAGERAPDLSDLPAELASAVQAMLARLA